MWAFELGVLKGKRSHSEELIEKWDTWLLLGPQDGTHFSMMKIGWLVASRNRGGDLKHLALVRSKWADPPCQYQEVTIPVCFCFFHYWVLAVVAL